MLCLKVNQPDKLPNSRQVSQLESQLIHILGNHVDNMRILSIVSDNPYLCILTEHYNERNLMEPQFYMSILLIVLIA